jgi:hypothetical protein
MLITSLWHQENSSWQAKQSIPHTAVTFYGDCVEMWEESTTNFGDKGTRCCITTTHHLLYPSFITRQFLTKNNKTVVPHAPQFSLFLWIKIKLKGLRFDKLRWLRQNRRRCWTPTENTTSTMQLKKKTEVLGKVHTRGRRLFRVWRWPTGPKLVFNQMAAPVSEIMDDSL